MIEVDDVSHVFATRTGTTPALDSVRFVVWPNEFLTVIGRSGCGKSTLLRLVAGLLKPTSGSVTIDGIPVTGPRRDISMMFQQPALMPWRSVLANVMLPVEVFGLDRRRYTDRAHDLLRMVGLSGFENCLPRELSGGMQQRVSLCRSLVCGPKFMLMDEPFSALDALTRTELSEELQRLQMELKTTIVFVTHSIEEAVLLSDRVVVLSPRPGTVAEVVTVDIPRPRSLGRNAHALEVARISNELHDILVPS